MNKEERLNKLRRIIVEKGFCAINNLKNETKLSNSTLRRDLLDLEEEGIIERWHGGAASKDYARPSFESRMNINREKKEEIGRKAINLIKNNQVVIIDAGSTASMIVRNIHDFKKLTVITPSIYIARQLSNIMNVEIILTGGRLNLETNSLLGPLAEKIINEIFANIVFLACDSISSDLDVMVADFELANLKESLIKRAEKKILIADSTKFGKINIASIGNISIFDKVIVDSNLSEEMIEKIKTCGVDIL